MKRLLLLLVSLATLKADVLHFFDPLKTIDSCTSVRADYFIANDPVSLHGFFHRWEGAYHPRKGTNLALQDLRIDAGRGVDNGAYYIGLFYRYNVALRANRDFSDFYRTIKQHLDFVPSQIYRLRLQIEGVRQSGLLFSMRRILYAQDDHRVEIGGALHLGAGFDMQEGYIRGRAHIPDKRAYDVDAYAHYRYTHNYLYKLPVTQSRGVGIGSDVAIRYSDRQNGYMLTLLVNDLLSRIWWFDLPYSDVEIKTANRIYDEKGYMRYNPSVSGVERKVDFLQTISPRWRLEAEKQSGLYRFSCAVAHGYGTYFPSLAIGRLFENRQQLLVSYESRFRTVGIGYVNDFIRLMLRTDRLRHASAMGVSAQVLYRF